MFKIYFQQKDIGKISEFRPRLTRILTAVANWLPDINPLERVLRNLMCIDLLNRYLK